MKKYKILITWRLLCENIEKYKKILKKNNLIFDTLNVDQYAKKSQLLRILKKYDGIICGDDELDREVINSATNLKIISKWGTGLDSIDLRFAKEKKIKVFNSPGAFTDSVSDHAIALLLNITRNITSNDQDIRNGIWSKKLCENLSDLRIGIIGYGKIGRMIHKKLKVFTKRFLINDKKKLKINVPKNKIYKVADVIILCVDLNHTTKNLIQMKQFKLMKKNTILINICRGSVIDNKALFSALKNKLIYSAGLDVFDSEPLKKK